MPIGPLDDLPQADADGPAKQGAQEVGSLTTPLW
jgi:hypothetical protein